MITVNQWYTSARYLRSTSDIPLCATQRWAVNTQERQAVDLLVKPHLIRDTWSPHCVLCGMWSLPQRGLWHTDFELTGRNMTFTRTAPVTIQRSLPSKRQLLVFTGCSFMHAPGEQVPGRNPQGHHTISSRSLKLVFSAFSMVRNRLCQCLTAHAETKHSCTMHQTKH